jgi:uncharacterized protein YggU (UPF0235/DUF167 family)
MTEAAFSSSASRPNPRAPGSPGFILPPTASWSLQIKVRAQPEKGKANEAAIELLAEALSLPKRAFAIIAGESDRLKTVRIAGAPATISQRLTLLIQDFSS